MKISKNVKKTLNRILNAKEPTQIDLGQVTTSKTVRKFAVSCGLGYDAAIAQKTTHSILKKKLNKIGMGKLIYLFLELVYSVAAHRKTCRKLVPSVLFKAILAGLKRVAKIDALDASTRALAHVGRTLLVAHSAVKGNKDRRKSVFLGDP